MSTQLTTMESTVLSFENGFNQVNAYKQNFKKEAGFALQLLKSNDFLRSTAQGNPDSLQNAITNLAAIGISLNPATKEAYLVPRSRAVCLDISAVGLIKLATDAGSIKWAQAEIVRKNDKFIRNGLGERPIHQFEEFGDRGDIVGVYAVAKTHDGDYLVSVMTIKECHDIRDRSEAWKAFTSGKTKSCPWSTDEGEMMKKTVIKRASKLWPKSERLDTAVQVLNEHEGIDFNSPKGAFIDTPSPEISADDKTFKNIRDLLKANSRSEEQLLKYINGKFKSELKTIEELEPVHIEEAYRAMGGAK